MRRLKRLALWTLVGLPLFATTMAVGVAVAAWTGIWLVRELWRELD